MARSDDVAGNNEHTATVNLNVDNTAPNLNLPYSPMGYDPSKAIFLSSDAGSGLAQARVTFSGGGITPRVYTFSPLAGTETISWDGRDGSGNSVAPGTYNVLIEVWDVVGNYSSTTGQWVVVAAPAPTSTRIPWPTFTRTPSPTVTTTSLPPTKAVANTQAVSTSSPSPTNTKPASSAPVIPTIVLPPPLSGLPVWTLFLPGLIVVGWLFVNGGSFFFDRRWSEVRKLQQDVISYRKSISSIEEGDTHD
jgi:hypothetical protein